MPLLTLARALVMLLVCAVFSHASASSSSGLHADESISDSSTVDLIVVLKSSRVLYLYDDGLVVDQFPIALGKNPRGTKRRRGDKKTPEGAYTLDWRNPESIFHRSIHVSYPNVRDRRISAAHGVDPGDLIMIHGQPDYDDRERKGDWTNGCIAVSNAAMDKIWSSVENGTRIHIYP